MIQFQNSLPVLLSVVIFFLLIILVILVYRFKFLTGLKIWILRGLRILALLLLFLIILDPITKKDKVITHPTRVLVLIDTSASMGIEDYKNNDRLELVKEFLDRDNFIRKDKRENFQFKYFQFSSDVRSIDKKDVKRLKPDGEMTGLVNAVRDIFEENVFGNIGGMLLFSDGIENISINPDSQIREFSIVKYPVVVYGIGDYYKDRDLAITELNVPEIFYQNEKGKIMFRIRALNVEGGAITVKASIDGGEVREFNFKPETNAVNKTFEFELIPEEPGKHNLELEISGDFDEDNTKDNKSDRDFLVRKPQKDILFIEFKPGWDYVFTKRLFSKNKRLNLVTYVFDKKGKSISPKPDHSALKDIDLDKFELVILGHPTSGVIDPVIFKKIRRQVRNKGLSLLLFLGDSAELPDPLEKMLPFELFGLNDGIDIQFNLTEQGRFHPILRDLNKTTLADLPSLKTGISIEEPGSGVQILANHKTMGETEDSIPVILESKFGLGKILVFAAEGFWQWQFLLSGVDEQSNFWNRTLDRVTRYMIEEKDIKNIAILPLPSHIVTSQRFLLQIRVLDSVYFPIDNPEINLILTGPDSDKKLSVSESDRLRGIFETEIELKTAGDYKLNLKVSENGIELGSDSAEFEVDRFNIELMNKSKNDQLLKKIAYTTGGIYFDGLPDEDITDMLMDYSSKEQVVDINRVWDNFPVFLLIILVLGLEWYLRKKYGLS